MLLGLGHHVGGRVDPDRLARRHQEGQVGGDGPRAAAHVEQALTRAQVGERGTRSNSRRCARCGCAAPTHGARACRSCVHCGVPEMPEMQALSERLDALLAGADPRPGRPARVLLPQDLRPVARLPQGPTAPARSAAGPSTSSGSSTTATGWCCICPRRAGSTSRSRPRRRSPVVPVARFVFATGRAPGSTGRAWACWCASTARSARRRGGCWRRATRARWPGWGPRSGSEAFAEFIRTSDSRRHLTTDLRDQHVVAGIGRGLGRRHSAPGQAVALRLAALA